MSFRLQIPQTIYETMLQQAQAEKPSECCGLLAGNVKEGIGSVEAIYPLENALNSPVEFESNPRSMFEAHKDMRNRNIDVIAVYHSHPTSEPIPSKKDLAKNYSTEVMNLIISLMDEQPSVRGWWLQESTYEEGEWEITKLESSKMDSE